MAEVASAYVSLMPSARGFGKKLDSEIGGDVDKSGRKAGLSFGKLFAAGAALGLGAKAFSFLGDSLAEATEAAVVGSRTENVISKMGNAANISAGQVGKLAEAISAKTGIDDEAIQSGQNMLLTFGRIRNEVGRGNAVFDRASSLMVDMSRAMGTDAKAAALQLGKALNDPIKGVASLGRAGVQFSVDQQAAIKAMVDSGNTLGAQKIILGEVERQFGGAAAAMATPADKARVAWANLKEQLGTQLLPTVNTVLTTFTTQGIPVLVAFGGAVARVTGFVSRHRNAIAALVVAVTAAVAVTRLHAAVLAVQAAGGLMAALKATKLVTAATKTYTAFQWLLNAALTANPIGIVVVALAALGAGLVLAYKKSETFRNVVNNAFAAVRSGAQSVANFVTKTIPAAFNSVVTFVRGIPGKIAAIFTGAASIFYNAGVQLMAQLAAGITAKIGDAINAAKAGLSKLKGLLPGSPIKWGPLKNWNQGGAGKRLMDLVAKGIADATPKTVKAAKTAFDKIADSLTATRDRLKGELEGFKSDFASIKDTVAGAFAGNLFDVSATLDDAGNVSKTVGQNFVDNLMGKKAELAGLLSSFKTLAGWGIDPKFLTQLFSSGNGGLITDLAGMGQAGAVEAANLFGDVANLGSQLGEAVAKNDPVSDRIDETNRLLGVVSDQLAYLGSDIGKELNQASAQAHRNRKNRGKGKK